MGKKTTVNTKVAAANEKKSAAKAEKDRKKADDLEAKEAEEWSKGSRKESKADREAKKKADKLAKKSESRDLLEDEESKLPKPKGTAKTALKRTEKAAKVSEENKVIPEFGASNIDDALDLLTISDDKKALQAKDIERHPERRFKAALAAYEEQVMDSFKKDYPGLRLNQLKQKIYKEFEKSPENPFNQANIVAYNVSKEGAVEMKDKRRQETEDRLRI